MSESGERTTPLLSVESVCSGYQRRDVIIDVSLEVRPNELVAVIGHNGAGKSTLMRTIMGLTPMRTGRVLFGDTDVSKLPTAKRVEAGVCLVPQLGNTLPDLTVNENLELSAHARYKDTGDREQAVEEVYEEFPILKERARQHAKLLSGGQRQMLALGIALLKRPKVLMLDEPSLGLSPTLARRLFDNIVEISSNRDTSVLIVEQNVRDVLGIAGRAYVMRSGEIVMAESSEKILEMSDLFSIL